MFSKDMLISTTCGFRKVHFLEKYSMVHNCISHTKDIFSAEILKDSDILYNVSLSDGSSIIVSEKQQFLTLDSNYTYTWIPFSSLYHGVPLYVDSPYLCPIGKGIDSSLSFLLGIFSVKSSITQRIITSNNIPLLKKVRLLWKDCFNENLKDICDSDMLSLYAPESSIGLNKISILFKNLEEIPIYILDSSYENAKSYIKGILSVVKQQEMLDNIAFFFKSKYKLVRQLQLLLNRFNIDSNIEFNILFLPKDFNKILEYKQSNFNIFKYFSKKLFKFKLVTDIKKQSNEEGVLLITPYSYFINNVITKNLI